MAAHLLGLCALAASATAEAAPALRVQTTQKGDFVLFGNTLEQEYRLGTPTPVVGQVGPCGLLGLGDGDTGGDCLWQSDAPMNGNARVNGVVSPGQARSTAMLQLPPGATVTHAYLYWSAHRILGPDATATIERPGVMNGSFNVTAIDTYDTDIWYQSVADITAIVQQLGAGAYRVSGVAMNDPRSLLADETDFAGWYVVVLYEDPSTTLRNLALFDGFDLVDFGSDQNVTISGFLAPLAGFDAKLGVASFESESSLTGDQLFFNGGAALSDAQNPANNFFNSTRSYLGSPVSVTGDLPQLTGTPGSMSGMDLDVVDVTSKIAPGDSSATIHATSSGDTYLLGAFVTSIATFVPDFTTSNKTATDLDAGTLVPGDTIEYTIDVANTGNDTAVMVSVEDTIPTGATYVPGSIKIVSGPNTGPKTDAAGDDQADFDGSKIVVRLGTGANASQGGSIGIGGSTTVKFRVTVNANVSGTISNQAVIHSQGMLGSPPTTTPTDGDGTTDGSQPTDVTVDNCNGDQDCSPLEPTCDLTTHTCVCNPGSPEICGDGKDNDCDGNIDDGCDADGDGLPDDVEVMIGTDPHDADSDDDGVMDGDEPMPGVDSDGDGLINALDPDSDNDGLFDGTELGKDCSGPGTQGSGHCMADGDGGATTTDPLVADTDGGGVSDGSEDVNLNGVIDAGETDPNDPSDDAQNQDTDGDGLSNGLEMQIGTDPNDADSDDDGLSDGEEPNPTLDSDGDGLINPLDPDGDNDGIQDGTEAGKDCSGADTDPATCVPDADGGATTTSVLGNDTDHGGVHDGDEDANHDGAIDPGETDPNDPTDDAPVACQVDSDCGNAMSGKVCDDGSKVCISGCRGTGGNGCPSGYDCTSLDETIGTCIPQETSGEGGAAGVGGSAAQSGSGAGGDSANGSLSGGGCNCSISEPTEGHLTDALAIGLAVAALSRRRRRHAG